MLITEAEPLMLYFAWEFLHQVNIWPSMAPIFEIIFHPGRLLGTLE